MLDIFEPDKPDTSGIAGASQAIARAAGRLVYSMLRSIRYLEPAAAEHFQALLSPETLWVLGIILAGWVLATLIGGPIALVVNGLLAAYGLYQLYEQLAVTWDNLSDWAIAAYNAKNEKDIDKAAQFFARAVAQGALTIIEVIVTHKVFKSISKSLKSRYPTPDWLKQEYEQATKAKSEEPIRPKDKREGTRAQGERTLRAGPEPVIPPIPPAGSGFPWLALSLGTITLVGAGTALAIGLSDSPPRRKRE